MKINQNQATTDLQMVVVPGFVPIGVGSWPVPQVHRRILEDYTARVFALWTTEIMLFDVELMIDEDEI